MTLRAGPVRKFFHRAGGYVPRDQHEGTNRLYVVKRIETGFYSLSRSANAVMNGSHLSAA